LHKISVQEHGMIVPQSLWTTYAVDAHSE